MTQVAWGTPTGRGVVAAATLGSGLTLLDGTVVNVALRTVGDDLDASLAQLQWITNGYFLSLASLILIGGALGDRLGRRRVGPGARRRRARRRAPRPARVAGRCVEGRDPEEDACSPCTRRDPREHLPTLRSS